MGYRDDELAFRRRRDLLQREVDALVDLREELTRRRDVSRERLRRARFKLALVKLRRCLRRHPILTILGLAIATITVTVKIETLAKERTREQQLRAVLGQGCKTELSVSSQPGGMVYLNGVRMGKAPVQRAICPGRYLLQVTRRNMLPWQRSVTIGETALVRIRAALIPLRNRPGDAMVIHSVPDNAVVFVNGQQVGITPVLVRSKAWKDPDSPDDGTLRIGLWAPGHPPRSQRIRLARDVWFQLPPPPAEAPGGRRP